MRQLILLFTGFMLCILILPAQTKIIAFKSTGGTMADFIYKGYDNLGLVERTVTTIDSIILLQDSSVIVIRSQKHLINGYKAPSPDGWPDFFQKDTVLHFPPFDYEAITYEQMTAMFHDEAVFIGFDREEMNKRAEDIKRSRTSKQPIEPIAPVPTPQPQPTISVPVTPDSLTPENKPITPTPVQQPQPAVPQDEYQPQPKPNTPQPAQQKGNVWPFAMLALFLGVYGLLRTALKSS